MNTLPFSRLRCGVCRKLIKRTDYILLDMLNTAIHHRCYNSEASLIEVKDQGILNEIQKRYDFL